MLLEKIGGGVVTGIEMAAGLLFVWATRRARRVGGGLDAEADRMLDAGLDRVHDLVSEALGGQDPVLARLEEEAQAGGEALSPRTRQRLELALEDAAGRDPGFAAALDQAVAEVQTADRRFGGQVLRGNLFTGPTALQVGDHNTQTNAFGA